MEKIDFIKAKIKELILQSKMTQKELAAALKVTQSCIAHYVKGDIMPALDTFAKLCEILDVDANYVLGISRSI